jgi:carbon-monoxide dehydrogenase large subunit
MAEVGGDRLIVHIGSQNPQARVIRCATSSKMPKDKVRVVVRDIGGGFGMKVGIRPQKRSRCGRPAAEASISGTPSAARNAPARRPAATSC